MFDWIIYSYYNNNLLFYFELIEIVKYNLEKKTVLDDEVMDKNIENQFHKYNIFK